MAEEDKSNKGLQVVDNPEALLTHNTIKLGPSNELILTGLSEEEISALRVKFAEGMIDLNRKAQELNIDVKALDHALTTLGQQTKQASKSGDSITASFTQDSSLGRTEVLMGNTEQAARGRLTRSQIGEKDHTLTYIIIGVIVFIVILVIAAT